MTIGERVAFRRKQLGLTQLELAQKMGYKSKTTINKIELGINDISQKNIWKLAEALDTNPAWLMGWEEKETPALSEKQETALKFVETLSEEKLDAMIKFFESDEKINAILKLLGE